MILHFEPPPPLYSTYGYAWVCIENIDTCIQKMDTCIQKMDTFRAQVAFFFQ